jgi:hypothetical protein
MIKPVLNRNVGRIRYFSYFLQTLIDLYIHVSYELCAVGETIAIHLYGTKKLEQLFMLF